MAQKKIFCPKCGKPLSVDETLDHVFCMHCGNSIDITIPESFESSYDKVEEKEPIKSTPKSEKAPKKAKRVPEPMPEPEIDEDVEDEVDEEIDDEFEGENDSTAKALLKIHEEEAEKERRQIAAEKKLRNRSAGEVGVLYSEATDEEKEEQKKLSFGAYFKSILSSSRKLFILGIAAVAIFFIGVIVLAASNGHAVVGIVVSLILLGLFGVALSLDYRKRKCSKCGTDLSIVDIDYERVSMETDKNGKVFAKYRFNLECPKCGEVKVFEKKVAAKNGHFDLRAAVGRKDSAGNETFKEKMETFGGVLLTLAVGVICLIIGIINFMGGPADNSTEDIVYDDPMDYYGFYSVTYVTNSDNSGMIGMEKLSIKFEEEGVSFSGTQATEEGLDGTYSYKYVNAEYVYREVASPSYTDKDAIVVNMSDEKVLVFYVWNEDPYIFEMGGAGIMITSLEDDYDWDEDEFGILEEVPGGKKPTLDPEAYGTYVIDESYTADKYSYMFGKSNFAIKITEKKAIISGYANQEIAGTYDYEYIEVTDILKRVSQPYYYGYDAILIKISDTEQLVLYYFGYQTDAYKFGLNRDIHLCCID